jgi:hypothetical protein
MAYRVLSLKQIVRKTVAESEMKPRQIVGRKTPRLHLRSAHIWGRFTRPKEEWQLRPAQIIGLADRGFVGTTFTFV